ncbi:hypothetical protein HMPREF9336_04207 [Segniliparus rugosus ATCC BAA-974]|uniref:Uncharacterized protein n=1 Tax=Segniliparus rugosus (strain ATCC BAA-974 / DSM 45345 / CCUG 50838 / CIP 108380 / JCM 13579 / CDC 945) TaxID=679197 RepID=U1LMZ2_SEGRC|nr:hypothetical protein HMPREF9336_04207 [Segniliparus rugosus ATCC BAA-974]
MRRAAASRSKAALAATRTTPGGRTVKSEASPLVNGHWAITAASEGSFAASAMTCPPPKDVPKTAILRGSAPGAERA